MIALLNTDRDNNRVSLLYDNVDSLNTNPEHTATENKLHHGAILPPKFLGTQYSMSCVTRYRGHAIHVIPLTFSILSNHHRSPYDKLRNGFSGDYID